MMGYKILFTINVLNEFYTDSLCKDLEITLSKETLTLLKRYGLLWRMVDHKLLVLVKTTEANKPAVPLEAQAKFSFYIKMLNPHFYNFTNLKYNPRADNRFYFNNVHQNKVLADHSLTAKIAAYNAANNYDVGDFAANGSGEIFEAIRISKPGNAHPLTEGNFWLKKSKTPYVSPLDQIEVASYSYVVYVAPAKNITINVLGLNRVTNLYDLKVMDTQNLEFDEPQNSVTVKLNTLPAGKYILKVNAVEKVVYKDDVITNRNIFGLIEVFNHLPASSAFALLDVGGKLKSPVYSLRFANRSVIWRFLARSSDVTEVKDTSSSISFSAEAGNQFVSKNPVPLKEKPIKTLVLKSVIYGDIKPLPNPRTDRLTFIVKNGYSYLCSELYLNY